jgi:hypothetical protein
MENNPQRRGKRTNEPGPWGRRAARNLEDLREQSRLSQKDLAAAAERLGRPMTMQIVSKTEVTPDYQVSELDGWMWALGERPLDRGFDAPQLQIALEVDRERWFTRQNRPNHLPGSPLGDPLQEHPEVTKAIINVARRARRAGLGVQSLHYALEYAYLMASSEDED